jgi:uncharacterized protein
MSELIYNRAQRIAALKEIIQHLHSGAAPDDVKQRLHEIVRQTNPSEIMTMEQELIAGGMPVEEVRSMCDLHSQVTRDVLVQLPHSAELLPGHPVDTFRRENEALQASIAKARTAIKDLQSLEANYSTSLSALRQSVNELMDIDKHYQRKEHALFSLLERHGIAGPSKVMWAKDDDVRASLKQTQEALRTATAPFQGIVAIANKAFAALEEMIYKEENILFPMALQTLTENEWAEVWAASPKYGWCLVEPRRGYVPPTTFEVANSVPLDGKIGMPTGNVSVEQLIAVLSALPIDLTFVDMDDRVAFFTEGPERIFARSKAIVGRKVQHCHPPSSVDVVDHILDDFRSGRQNVAEFWINFHGRFVHIRYFAVRDASGGYLGTIEVTQDLTPLRALEGERRLLEYTTN